MTASAFGALLRKGRRRMDKDDPGSRQLADGDSAGPHADPGTPVVLEHAGIHFPPPLIYLIGFVAGALAEQVLPLPDPPQGPASVAGFVFVVIGIALSSASVGRFRRASTSVIPNQPAKVLVTSGPYRFSRNPMYVAITLAYIGSAFIVRMLWPLAALPVVLLVVGRYVIRKEERYLESAFGEDYRRYKKFVRRWI